MSEKKKKMFFMSLISLLTLTVVIGTSYAFFTYSREGQKKNQMTTGTFQIVFKDESNEVKEIINKIQLIDWIQSEEGYPVLNYKN